MKYFSSLPEYNFFGLYFLHFFVHFFGVYMCACVCGYIHAYLCTCLWKPESDVECFPQLLSYVILF